MTSLDIAVVSRDPAVRLAAARAFDRAPASWKIRLHEEAPEDADVVVFGVDLRHAANGHILFDPAGDHGVIEQVKRSVSSARSKVFVVVGAGRGAGATSLALHLAACAARERSACFVDLDLEWGAAARLGIDGPHKTWDMDATDETDMRLAALPVGGGFRALLAPRALPERDEQSASVAGLDDALSFAAGEFERVVIDCSDTRLLDAVIAGADAGVLVVPASMPGASRAADLLAARTELRWAVVLNRLGPGGETSRAELHRTIGTRSAVELPCTPALRDAEDGGRLLTSPWSRYVRATNRLLLALEAAT